MDGDFVQERTFLSQKFSQLVENEHCQVLCCAKTKEKTIADKLEPMNPTRNFIKKGMATIERDILESTSFCTGQ